MSTSFLLKNIEIFGKLVLWKDTIRYSIHRSLRSDNIELYA